MKNFYYTIVKDTRTSYGRKQTANIYTVKRNNIIFCCATTWNTAGYRGESSEVFNALMKAGYIPKKYYKSSESPNSTGGYFMGDVRKKYGIYMIPQC